LTVENVETILGGRWRGVQRWNFRYPTL